MNYVSVNITITLLKKKKIPVSFSSQWAKKIINGSVIAKKQKKKRIFSKQLFCCFL